MQSLKPSIFESLSADIEYLYVNNEPIYELNKIFNDLPQRSRNIHIAWIYNALNRRCLFEMQYDVTNKIHQTWGIFNLQDNTIMQIDINSIINNPKQETNYFISVSQHPSHNGVYIVRMYLKDFKTYFALLTIYDDTVSIQELLTMNSYTKSIDVLFSFDDYIVIQSSLIGETTILNTDYKGNDVKAYIDINQPLVIANNKDTIDIVSLSDNKVIKSFEKKDYNIDEYILAADITNNDSTLVAITNRFNYGNLLLLEFNKDQINSTKFDVNTYGQAYIDFYGLAIYNGSNFMYQVFDGDSYEIKGNKIAINHDLYEAEVAKLVSEIEIYKPLQNMVNAYL